MRQIHGGDLLLFRVGGEKQSPQDREDKLWTGIDPEWNLPKGLNFQGEAEDGWFSLLSGTLPFSHHFLVILFHIIIPSSYPFPVLKICCSRKVQEWCWRTFKRAGHWAKHCLPCITVPFGLTLGDSAPAHSGRDQHPSRSGIPREMCETQSAWRVDTGNGSEAKCLSKARLGVWKGRRGQENVQSLGSGQCGFFSWRRDDTA